MYYDYDPNRSEEELREEELADAENLIRNGANTRQIMRRQFQFIGQSDLYKIYRKYGMQPGDNDDDLW